jgi:lipoteichoic acid synthase
MEVKVSMLENNDYRKSKILSVLFMKYWLLIFFIVTIAYLELIYLLWNFKSLSLDYFFPVLFALCAGSILFLLSSLLQTKANRIIALLLTFLLILVYEVQLVYFCIFHTTLSLYSLTAGSDALQFEDVIFTAILKNIIGIVMLFLPFIMLLIIGRKLTFHRIKRPSLYIISICIITSYTMSILCVDLSDRSPISQHSLYYNTSSPELSVVKLGLLTTMRLDFERLIFGINQDDDTNETAFNDDNNSMSTSTSISTTTAIQKSIPIPTSTPILKPIKTEPKPTITYNIMNIDFKSLIAKEKNQGLLNMHKYFSSVTPTKKNKYTGMFKGNNLILITAESFSPYAINKFLTPTLYEMSSTGFVFNNFYNPVWGVSTSDGEYVACTGLIPKSGVWSFAKSSTNYLPFVMGNQFKKLGYSTRAYHDHTYTYYKRNISHPNMGYIFKAVGNGLIVKPTWPESDVEMINVTADEYIGPKPFHTYYMTVSGHMNYSFSGNYIDKKNKPLVDKLPYSNPSKAYIAGNLELEFALKALISKLEAAGIADKTVIAISPDHYPYGLPRECIDELAGHKVENNFELYKSTFILWKKGMKPLIIDKPCSSLDINPTLSNLFGLDYDSRLLMGSDILSDTPPLVIFSNRSWITNKARYNTVTNTLTYTGIPEKDKSYLKEVNKTVADKFKYSAKILETNYYNKILHKSDQR